MYKNKKLRFALKESHTDVMDRLLYLQHNKWKYREDREFAPFQVEVRSGKSILRFALGRTVIYYDLTYKGDVLIARRRLSFRNIITYGTVLILDGYFMYLARTGGLRGIVFVCTWIALQVVAVLAVYKYGDYCVDRFVRKYLAEQIMQEGEA